MKYPPPLQPRELIDLMVVPERDSIYVLGSFEKRVTFYSQQVRAINLVHALLGTAEGLLSSEVAIVGAGAAGLTTAAALLELSGVHVTLLEREDRELSLQRTCTHRWLHPHLYDWPEEGCFEPEAQLPFLTWSANTASNVAGQIVDAWSLLRERHEARLSLLFNISQLKLTFDLRPGATLDWFDDDGHKTRHFEIVILAVGYGMEPAGDFQGSYWAGDDIEYVASRRQKWLVTGCGDGGLTDVLRLVIHDSAKYSQLAWLVGDVTDHPDCQALLEAENLRSREKVHSSYGKLVDPVAAKMLAHLRRTDVTLNGLNRYPFGSHSSILNRFLVSQLAELKKVRYRAGAATIAPTTDNSILVRFEFEDGKEEVFQRVLRRHGPEPAIKKYFREIWNAFETQRRAWEELRSLLDRSRIPMWTEDRVRRQHPVSSRPTSMKPREETHLDMTQPIDKAGDESITAEVDATVDVPSKGGPLRVSLKIRAVNTTHRNLPFTSGADYKLALKKATDISADDAYGKLATQHEDDKLAVTFAGRPPIPAGGSYGWTLEFSTPGMFHSEAGVISGPYTLIPQHEFLGVPVRFHTFWYEFIFRKPDDAFAWFKEYKVIQSNNRGLRPVIKQGRSLTRCGFEQFQLGKDEGLRLHFTCLYRPARIRDMFLRVILLDTI